MLRLPIIADRPGGAIPEMSEERECAAEVVSALLRGKLQGQQMVFRVIGVWPLIHESEAREQIHAWPVARIHLSQHERRAIGTPRIITKPHNHRGEQRVSEMLPRTFSSVAMYEIW